MKKLFTSILITTFTFLNSTISFGFNDINGHWAENYIINMKNANVLNQFNSENLLPDIPISRGECAELISDFLEIYYNYSPPSIDGFFEYNDLEDNTPQTNKIRALNRYYYYSEFTNNNSSKEQNKIINGYPDGTFKPNAQISRAEFAKMLVSSLDCFGYLRAGNSGWYYSDVGGENWTHWGSKYIDIAYGLNIMNGYYQYRRPDNFLYIEFKPDSPITRAEAIKMVSSARGFVFQNLATRPSGSVFLNYLERNDGLKPITESQHKVQIYIPKDWSITLNDFGSGYKINKNFFLAVHPYFNVSGKELENSLDFYKNKGYTAEKTSIPNAEKAFKLTKGDDIVILASRKNSIVIMSLSQIDSNDPDYKQSVNAINSLRFIE